MKIGVYAIALNEQANVKAWAESIGRVDCILVADTGSTDDTRLLAKTAGCSVKQISIVPFRFDDAWNAALALMPADLDVVVGASLDMRFPPGWQAQLRREWQEGENISLQSWFEFEGLRWRHPFAHSRHGFRYRFPIHELLLPDPRVAEKRVDSELVFTHEGGSRQSADGTAERNLAMLRAAVVENPHDTRQQHYLGRELMYAKQWDEAIAVLTDHANSGAFAEERGESWRYIGDCYRGQLPIEDVPLAPYRSATAVDPGRRDGWVALADLCREQGRWEECLEAAETALSITEKSWWFNWPFAWGAMPHDLAALACHFLGRNDEAIIHGEHAVALAPDDARLAANLGYYREAGATVDA